MTGGGGLVDMTLVVSLAAGDIAPRVPYGIASCLFAFFHRKGTFENKSIFPILCKSKTVANRRKLQLYFSLQIVWMWIHKNAGCYPGVISVTCVPTGTTSSTAPGPVLSWVGYRVGN